jgi:hypothetical protein
MKQTRHTQPNIQSITGNEYQVAAHMQYIMQLNSQIHGKHAEPSRANTTPEEIKATYSINVTAQI